jgi:hypothetical protein
MAARRVRSAEHLKSNMERLQEILSGIDQIAATHTTDRVAALANHQRMINLSESMEKTLEKQEQSLDKLMKMANFSVSM